MANRAAAIARPAAPDPVSLAADLIRCRSVTPADDGALSVAGGALAAIGFTVTMLRFGSTPNLYARIGEGRPRFCFAGHTDVVPAGPGWDADPFGGMVRDGMLIGRGACDMKGAVAAFIAAAAAHRPRGAIAVLLTGDEEGEATDGTVRVLDWLVRRDELPAFCVVGEPTCRDRLGDTVKVGRRGSFSATVTVRGRQGHVAYPQHADNAVHRLARAVAALAAAPLDEGSADFAPSTVQVTSFDVGNPAGNVVPGEAVARLNVRFNDRQTPAALEAWLRGEIARHAPDFTLACRCSAEPFLTPRGPGLERAVAAIAGATGVAPALDTGGGTSDARFIARHCPVIEFGLVGRTMHAVGEHVAVADLALLARAYGALLAAFDP